LPVALWRSLRFAYRLPALHVSIETVYNWKTDARMGRNVPAVDRHAGRWDVAPRELQLREVARVATSGL
jgi:hypothetical protein